MIFGYQRVSTKDQGFDLQTDALKKYGCDKIFSDVASGAKASRPSLDNLISQLRNGDVYVRTYEGFSHLYSRILFYRKYSQLKLQITPELVQFYYLINIRVWSWGSHCAHGLGV